MSGKCISNGSMGNKMLRNIICDAKTYIAAEGYYFIFHTDFKTHHSNNHNCEIQIRGDKQGF